MYTYFPKFLPSTKLFIEYFSLQKKTFLYLIDFVGVNILCKDF